MVTITNYTEGLQPRKKPLLSERPLSLGDEVGRHDLFDHLLFNHEVAELVEDGGRQSFFDVGDGFPSREVALTALFLEEAQLPQAFALEDLHGMLGKADGLRLGGDLHLQAACLQQCRHKLFRRLGQYHPCRERSFLSFFTVGEEECKYALPSPKAQHTDTKTEASADKVFPQTSIQAFVA